MDKMTVPVFAVGLIVGMGLGFVFERTPPWLGRQQSGCASGPAGQWAQPGIRVLDPPGRNRTTALASASSGSAPVFLMTIRRSGESRESHISVLPDKMLEAKGTTLRSLLAHVWNIGTEAVLTSVPVPILAEKYDVTMHMAGRGRFVYQPVMRSVLEQVFALSVRAEQRPIGQMLLRASDVSGSRLSAASSVPGETWVSPGHLKTPQMTMGALARILGGMLGKDVVDVTGVTGAYAIELTWREGDVESLKEALQNRLGLDLQESQEESLRTCIVVTQD